MSYLIHLLTHLTFNIMMSLGLNLILGYTGMISIAHAAFFGLGAYALAIAMTSLGMSFLPALLFGMVIAGLVAGIFARILSRLSGDYFVLGTLGISYIVYGLVINLTSLTRGPLGIPGIPRPHIFGISFESNEAFLLLSCVLMFALIFLTHRIVSSSFGRVLKTIREDEEAVRVFGYNTFSYKAAIFIIGAIFAAIAGGLYASFVSYVGPDILNTPESIFYLTMVVLGGVASIRGSILGAALIFLIPELLRFIGFTPDIAGHMRLAVYGVLLIVLMLWRPQGLIGEYKL